MLSKEEKQCGCCRETKPLSEFHARKKSKDDRQSKCKVCSRDELDHSLAMRALCSIFKEPDSGDRVCKSCGETKDCSEFSPEITSPGKLSTRCKSCLAGLSRRARRKRREETPKEYSEWMRARNLWNSYKLTSQAYNEMLLSCGGVCEVCGSPPGKKPLFVDHCHATGRIRGLLCGHCNTSLGLLREDISIMERLIKYTIRTSSNGKPDPSPSSDPS